MKLELRQEKLLEFVKSQHGDQKRKYTGEPYWHHVYEVAGIAQIVRYGIEIGFCHDLFEDTGCTFVMLSRKLSEIGYSDNECLIICNAVVELTDQYTRKAI